MSTTLTFRFILFLLTHLLVGQVNAQDTLSDVMVQKLKALNGKIGFVNGLGVSTLKAKTGKWEGEWYIPEISYSYELSIALRLTKHFWMGTGISYEYDRFRSKAFVNSGTGIYYSQGPNGLVPHTYSYTDDYERYSEGAIGYLSFPLNVEYASERKTGIYAKVGVRFSFPVLFESENNRVDNNKRIYQNKVVHPIVDYSRETVFGNYAFGLQINSGKTLGTVGLAYSHGLVRSDKGNPMALRFEVAIQSLLANAADSKKNFQIDILPKKRREYVYLELLGNKLSYSLNFEHSLISRQYFRWNVRLGGAIHNCGEVLDRLGIAGTSFILGETHALELGLNMHFYQNGDIKKDYAYAPTIGYRFEPLGRFFGRVIYTPVYYQALKYYCTFVSCSTHYGAVSIGMHF